MTEVPVQRIMNVYGYNLRMEEARALGKIHVAILGQNLGRMSTLMMGMFSNRFLA